MAETTVYVEQASPAAILRQLVLMLGIAASVALGVYVVMWARTPHMTMLYSDLSERDLSQVADALRAAQIPFELETGAGTIMVDSAKLDDARMKLAAAGLPKGGARGFELMDKQENFGTSQFMERARYQHAIEGELSRSIARIDNVRAARVHLALPAETVFARQRRAPSASVILDLYAGRPLGPEQIEAITHLVSASVPNLPADKVTVVDSRGNLLTSQGGDREMLLSSQRFDYARKLEQAYVARIEEILTPMVGADGVRAQVTAEIDFTQSEQTREMFNPDLPAVRSERVLEEEKTGEGPGGVPGALSNAPPSSAAAPEQATAGEAAASSATDEEVAPPSQRRKQSTRNYELDRTISHTKPHTGTLQRLSVAVVVRNQLPPPAPAPAGDAPAADAAPAEAPKPVEYSAEELARMTTLVKQAIGFDEARGDSVNVTAATFLTPPTPEALPPLPIWEQPWVWDVGKQAAGALFVLILVFGVLKPTMKNMLAKPSIAGSALATLDGAGAGGAHEGGALALPGANGAAALPAPGDPAREVAAAKQLLTAQGSDENLDLLRNSINQDPRAAALVVKGWVGSE